MRVLNARWWLPDVLNVALRSNRFRRQVFRDLRIEAWGNRPRYPKALPPWDEGSTQVDLAIHWENPPTTVFVEMKFLSNLSQRTANSATSADQLVRSIRVGLLECGWFEGYELPRASRDFVMLVAAPRKGHDLVARYRDPDRLTKAIPFAERLTGLPRQPFVGEFSFADLVRVLRRQRRWFTRAEKQVIDSLTEYLEFKLRQMPSLMHSALGDANEAAIA